MQKQREKILFYCIIAMMGSLFLSRTILSISILAFLLLCFFHRDAGSQLKTFFRSMLLWGMSALFFIVLLTGLWSGDQQAWLDIVRIKLPLLGMPLAFAASFSFTKKQWFVLASVFILLVTAGTCWSFSRYLMDMSVMHEAYLHARTIPTPLENDHVRFSWMVAVAILFAGWLWQSSPSARMKWIMGCVILWLVIYLHILAARTGLLSFYIIVLAVIIHFTFKTKKPLQGAGLVLCLLLLPVVAYFILPTFQNKVKYFRYDFGYFKDSHYLPGGNDAGRIISIKAGWGVLSEYPLEGAGFGDIVAATESWYQEYYPEVSQQDRILPSSEALVYGAGAGVPGLLIFIWALAVPFLLRVRNKGKWVLLNAVVAAGFLFDIGLEIQFGVFIYSFIVLMTWKWFRNEPLKH